jgi:hypothetical protein
MKRSLSDIEPSDEGDDFSPASKKSAVTPIKHFEGGLVIEIRSETDTDWRTCVIRNTVTTRSYRLTAIEYDTETENESDTDTETDTDTEEEEETETEVENESTAVDLTTETESDSERTTESGNCDSDTVVDSDDDSHLGGYASGAESDSKGSVDLPVTLVRFDDIGDADVCFVGDSVLLIIAENGRRCTPSSWRRKGTVEGDMVFELPVGTNVLTWAETRVGELFAQSVSVHREKFDSLPIGAQIAAGADLLSRKRVVMEKLTRYLESNTKDDQNRITLSRGILEEVFGCVF